MPQAKCVLADLKLDKKSVPDEVEAVWTVGSFVTSNTLYQVNQVTFINVSDHEVVVRMITRYLALQRYWDLEGG